MDYTQTLDKIVDAVKNRRPTKGFGTLIYQGTSAPIEKVGRSFELQIHQLAKDAFAAVIDYHTLDENEPSRRKLLTFYIWPPCKSLGIFKDMPRDYFGICAAMWVGAAEARVNLADQPFLFPEQEDGAPPMAKFAQAIVNLNALDISYVGSLIDFDNPIAPMEDFIDAVQPLWQPLLDGAMDALQQIASADADVTI